MEQTLTLSDILEIIQKNKDKIKLYGVKKLGVFGSFVRSGQISSSDIDFIVEFKEGKKSFDNYMGLKIFLEDLFHLTIDLVIKENIKPALKENILSSVVYAKGI